jgi:hypothetical protein
MAKAESAKSDIGTDLFNLRSVKSYILSAPSADADKIIPAAPKATA